MPLDPVGLYKVMPKFWKNVIAAILAVGLSVYGYYWLKPKPTIAPMELIQLQETIKHSQEMPIKQIEFDRDGSGYVLTKKFATDGCISVERHSLDATRPAVARYILDLSKQDPTTLPLLSLTPPRVAAFNSSTLGEGTAWAQGRCIMPQQHPDAPTFNAEPLDQCWALVTMYWRDGCIGQNKYNNCYNFWANEFRWIKCVH